MPTHMAASSYVAELTFLADLTLTLVSATAKLAAQALPPEQRAGIVAFLDSLDCRIELWLRRLDEVEDAAFRYTQLRRLVRDARRLLRLAVRLPAVHPSPTTPISELVADAQRAVDAYVRACMANLRGRARAACMHD